jgi:L-ornithine Nalpha-acyltransferase
MSDMYWKVARTQQDIDEVQRVRWQCLMEERAIGAPASGAIRRDIGCIDNLSTVWHLLVYSGSKAVGTARVARPNAELAALTGTRYGLELEQQLDLGRLGDVAGELAEVSRLCMSRASGVRGALRLYEGLYVVSRQLGVRHWIGGVDCQTPHRDEAELMRAALERRGWMSQRSLLSARCPRSPSAASRATVGNGATEASRFFSPAELDAARRGELDTLRLASTLESSARRLGARCVGAPISHPVFPRFVMPMMADLEELPADTLATFDRSLLAPALNSSTPAAATTATLYASLLDIARDSVRQLDAHPVAGELVRGTISREAYIGYLIQVVHQVRESGPMLAEAGARLEQLGHGPLAALFRAKAGEEDGHDRWALEDLAALGVEAGAVLNTPHRPAVSAYLAWTRHMVEAFPVAVLGLAFVLEWFGYCRAGRAASSLLKRRRIPNIASAVRFLQGHGDADQSHVAHLACALGEVREQSEKEAVLLAARLTARLYLGMFDQKAPPS